MNVNRKVARINAMAGRVDAYAGELSTPHQVWSSIAFLAVMAGLGFALWAVLP